MISDFNRLSRWVSSEILLTPNEKQRFTVIERMVELLKCLRKLQNFHGVWAVYSGLSRMCIQKLSWKGVNQKLISELELIEKLLDPAKNYKTYRELANTAEPFIPFEGRILSDLTFMEENPDILEGLVNFGKCELLAQIFNKIKAFQRSGPPLHCVENPLLKGFLANTSIFDEDLLESWQGGQDIRYSLLLGPRTLTH